MTGITSTRGDVAAAILDLSWVAIPADCKPHPGIAAALGRHVTDRDDDGRSATVDRYVARADAGSWSLSEDGTELLLSIRGCA